MESMKNFRSSGLFTALLLVYAQVTAVAQEKVPLKVAQKSLWLP